MHGQIPLLIQTFEEIKNACETDKIPLEHQKSLLKTIQGCVRLTTLLEAYLEDCVPQPDDSFIAKGKKALKRIKAEKDIAEIQRTLETYKSTLTLYFSHLTIMASSDSSLGPAGVDGKFYEVPAMGVNHFVGGSTYLSAYRNTSKTALWLLS